MTCEEFDAAWTRRLDDGSGRDAAPDDPFDHLRECPRCRATDARYRTLEHAIGLWADPPRPSPIESERLVAALAKARRESPRVVAFSTRTLAWGAGLAAAAVATAVILPRLADRGPLDSTAVVRPTAESLPTALADAGFATWRLAKDTSAPAAKLGAVLLEWSATAEEPRAVASTALPSAGSTEVLKSVGRQVNDGVEPLRSSALKAFDFLIAPAGGDVGPDRPGRGA